PQVDQQRARLRALDRARLRRPATTRRDYRRLGRERGVHLPALHLTERGLALLGEDQRDRLAFAPRQDEIDVDEPGVQLLRHEAADSGLARSREAHQHDVLLHDAAPLGVRARTWAVYPAKFRFISLSASPPNFSISACASTSATIPSAMTPIACTAMTSDRSDCAWAGAPVFKSTVLSGDISVEIGFIATRSTSGSPVVMPPSVPPARFVARARPGRISSCTSETLRRAASKPSPSSTPFTAGIDIRACASRPSSFRSHDTCEPRPTGVPKASTSTTPPRVSPAALAASMRAIISRSASASRQRTGLASAAWFRGVGTGTACRATTPPNSTTCEPISMPNCSSSSLHTAPQATRATVSRALARSRMSRASWRPYFRLPARAAEGGVPAGPSSGRGVRPLPPRRRERVREGRQAHHHQATRGDAEQQLIAGRVLGHAQRPDDRVAGRDRADLDGVERVEHVD